MNIRVKHERYGWGTATDLKTEGGENYFFVIFEDCSYWIPVRLLSFR